MANRYWVGGALTANWSEATGSITNWGSASNTRDLASVPGTSDAVFFDGVGFGASDSVMDATSTVNSIDFTGYANTLTQNDTVIFSLSGTGGVVCKFSSGMTYTILGAGGSAKISFDNTSGTVTLTTNGKTMPRLNRNGAGGTTTFGDNVTCVELIVHTNGVLNTNGKAVQCTIFGANNGNTRTLTLGSSAITLTGTGTVWNYPNSTNLTVSSNTAVVTLNDGSSSSKTVNCSNSSTHKNWNGISFVFGGSGSGALSMTGDCDVGGISVSNTGGAGFSKTTSGTQTYTSLNFTGYTGTYSGSAVVSIGGSLTFGSGMTVTATGVHTLTATGSVTSNAVATNTIPLTFNGSAQTFTIADTYVGTAAWIHSAGTLTLNNQAVTCLSLDTSNATTRTLTLGTNTLTLTSTATVAIFTAATATNLTVTATSGTIVINGVTANVRTFAGGGKTYGNLTYTGTVLISGANTFTTLASSGTVTTLTLTSAVTQTCTTFNGAGTAGNLNILNASTGASAATLSAGTANVNYMTVTDNTAAGAASPFSSTGGTGVSGNTNWTFIAVASTANQATHTPGGGVAAGGNIGM